MKKLLKIMPLIAAGGLAVLLAACSGGNGSGNPAAGPDATAGIVDDDRKTAETGETSAPEETPSPSAPAWTTDDQGRRLAGSDTKVTRDGSPKKYFTISFDDGITQDRKILDIYKKYGFTSGTFFINTGLFGARWDWVGQAVGKPGLSHLRWTEAELRTGIYDGFDVAVHTLSHGSLKNFDEAKVIREVQQDADNIYAITGVYPVGMAWPGGDTEYTKATVGIVRDRTTIGFSRGTTSTGSFRLPKEWLKWMPTCSVSDPNLLKYAQKFLNSEAKSDMLFYVWGHGYELDLYDSWDRLDELIRMMTEAEDVVPVSNSEFYWLFKDEIPATK